MRCWNGQPSEVVDAPSIPGGVQGQVGWGPGQPGLVTDLEVGSCGIRKVIVLLMGGKAQQ